MRRFQWISLAITTIASGYSFQPAAAQPGHAPFVFGQFEIDDFERTTGPSQIKPGLGNVGEPIFVKDTPSAYAPLNGILTPYTPLAEFSNMFPGGMMAGNETNGGQGNNVPSNPAYNHTTISQVTRTDANTADDVAITSGNQALRVSMWNAGAGDGDTSFDRPVSLVIKPNDFYGITDSRFNTFETVRANPAEYTVSIDFTFLANEIPDTFSTMLTQPYYRVGLYSNHAGAFNESPTNVLQGPPQLVFGNVDGDGDGLPNFTDPSYVDPLNPAGLPGSGVPGVIQRRYQFPASAMVWPANSLAGATPPAGSNPLRNSTGGYADAYVMGFVFNGNWTIGTPATFLIDNMQFLPRNPLSAADFNRDSQLSSLDWQILISNLNAAATDLAFDDGDATGDMLVNFDDFVRFEEVWDANNGGAGAFRAFLAGSGIPEPSTVVLVAFGLATLAMRRRRMARIIPALFMAVIVATVSSTASAQLANTLLFGWEPPPDPNLQLWQPAGDAANAAMPPVVTTSATGATQGSTRALSVTQNGSDFSWDAAVSIFGGDAGLPNQQAAFNNALDVGAQHFVLEMDVTYRDALIPPASFVNMSVRLQAGGGSTDQVNMLALAGNPDTGAVADQTIPVSIPLSIGPIDTADTLLSVPNQASLAGFYNITLGFNGDWGAGTPATFFVDNLRLRQVTQPSLLTLEVNRATGAATLRNVAGPNSGIGPVVLDYYEIASAAEANDADYNGNGAVDAADNVLWRDTLGQMVDAGTGADGNGDGMISPADYDLWRANFGSTGSNPSLNPAGWNSLDVQNVDAADGTDAGSTAGDSPLEGWDRSGSPSASVLSEAFLLGNSTWDDNESRPLGTIFTPGGSENLVLRFREPERPGFLRTGLVTYVGGAGSGLASASAVPEPQSAILLLIAGALVLGNLGSRRSAHAASRLAM